MDEETNPLEFFVAYQPGPDGKCFYLGDGKGNIRLFKTQAGLDTFLDENVSPENRDKIVTHPIQGLIALPEADTKAGALVPIKTLAPNAIPNATQLMNNYLRRRRN